MAFVSWENYETPFAIDSRADFAWMSNEDLAIVDLTAAAATNEVALPYPSSVDLFEETIVLYRQDWMLLLESLTDIDDGQIVRQYAVETSMLQIEHALTYNGQAADAEDESLKSKFAGPFGFGMKRVVKSGTASDLGMIIQLEDVNVFQYMPFARGLDLISPLYNVIYNKAFSIAGTTTVIAPADNDSTEGVADRYWHRKRELTSAERSFRNISLRFQLIDT